MTIENRYKFLEKYINNKNAGGADNSFYPIDQNEIEKAQIELDIIFPLQLQEFYLEIGYGFFRRAHNSPKDYIFYDTNRLNAPSQIVEMLKDGFASGMISEDVLENLEPGDIPFFEIGDSSSFMIMKTMSDNPNAVWSDTGIKIEDSLEQFIWNLYYIAPNYYLDKF